MDDNRYSKMQYRRSGRSGLKLPAISLGLWQNFGGDAPFERQRATVRRAFSPPGSRISTWPTITDRRMALRRRPSAGSWPRDLAGHRDRTVISTEAGYDM